MLKYIIVKSPSGEELPILFPAAIQHRNAVPKDLEVISAGFVMIFDGTLAFSDIGSDSLSVEPRPEDRALIEAMLNLGKPIDAGLELGDASETNNQPAALAVSR
ncbi:MAG TPA: hypothetical protein PKI20_13510 [Verrucomicrobiota bacterium]|mgnify:CR=1 FL=1|jgi:hypothetical protein|nr:hypothetical protein [Verrucomicrobiota bacterium]